MAETARWWEYPIDEALEAPESASFEPQTLMISANPEDHSLPWGVILENGSMYDFAALSFCGEAVAKTNWRADNYWFPRMWIEIHGVLTISGTSARIKARHPEGREPEKFPLDFAR